MKYVDLHCDTLTECFDNGYSLADCNLQNNLEKLKESGCAAQCFAVFTQGSGAALRFEKYLSFYKKSLEENNIPPILTAADLESCISNGVTGAVLTVENFGFVADLGEFKILKDEGVRMASPVWNYENPFAYPNLIFENGMPQFQKRESRGLKPLGRQAVEILDELKIIIDVSHLSDGGTDEILEGRKIPLVASHSNAAEVYNVSRNLTDGQIKKIAACGGVIGVNFCKDFLGGGNTLDCVLRHVRHVIKVGGADAVALGSDFDGIPAPPDLESCAKVPSLLQHLERNGIRGEILEKLCYKNFLRVFKDVCG